MRTLRAAIVLLILNTSFVPTSAQTPVGNPRSFTLKEQPYQRAEACLPCHQRQYNELRSSVKSGYRNVSPLFNALESAGNFLSGGRLRPVYGDSTKLTMANTPLNRNLASAEVFTHINQVQAGFCVSCHNAPVILRGEDPRTREIPEEPGIGNNFRPEQFRPLRDYHLVDGGGRQILPTEPGGDPPPGSHPSLGAAGITCDTCHNVAGPDLSRSFQRDGFANVSIEFFGSISKVGPFLFPVAVKGNFHTASQDPERIAYLRSSTLCNGCHDVRVPGGGSLTAFETNSNPGGAGVTHYRLENLSTEHTIGAYNSTNNPFGKVIRCQDCHMSLYPYGGNSTYQVGNLTITSPTPAVFASNFAAVPGVSTDFDFPLPKRTAATHYLTGIDVPLISTDQLRARLGADYPDVHQPGVDEYGIPNSLAQRREDLLKAAVRINLDRTDRTVGANGKFNVRVTAVALTGHRFPAGFSQERTTYIELAVRDRNGFLIYQSGYQVDKPHPDTGETEPDGSLHDEDLEHLIAVADPGRHAVPFVPGAGNNGHTNQVFYAGPDNGPEARVYAGIPKGLVLFRNELTRIFLPGDAIGRSDASGNRIVATRPHFEETFSAGFANSVDNFRSLQPLRATTFRYEITLPTQHELEMLGIDRLQGPLQVEAKVHFEHFPPLFLRFLARTTGPEGPAGRSLNLLNEGMIDDFLKNVRSIATANITVNLGR
ncbi:MAG: hypothetical protein HY646_13465 [Acidobacteria bacterium]|nr:hypothetical protein [Acidobacteriota bacterium]